MERSTLPSKQNEREGKFAKDEDLSVIAAQHFAKSKSSAGPEKGKILPHAGRQLNAGHSGGPGEKMMENHGIRIFSGARYRRVSIVKIHRADAAHRRQTAACDLSAHCCLTVMSNTVHYSVEAESMSVGLYIRDGANPENR